MTRVANPCSMQSTATAGVGPVAAQPALRHENERHPKVAINHQMCLELHAKTQGDTVNRGVVFVVEIHVADAHISLGIEIVVGADTIGCP